MWRRDHGGRAAAAVTQAQRLSWQCLHGHRSAAAARAIAGAALRRCARSSQCPPRAAAPLPSTDQSRRHRPRRQATLGLAPATQGLHLAAAACTPARRKPGSRHVLRGDLGPHPAVMSRLEPQRAKSAINPWDFVRICPIRNIDDSWQAVLTLLAGATHLIVCLKFEHAETRGPTLLLHISVDDGIQAGARGHPHCRTGVRQEVDQTWHHLQENGGRDGKEGGGCSMREQGPKAPDAKAHQAKQHV
jgi:hypothetical protein